ncbi:MAG: hypothetical protein ACRDHE_11800, partial [Ktedonobacterales bacterium]
MRPGATLTDRRQPSPARALAQRIAQLDARRRELGCTQAALGHVLGVSPSSVSRFFNPGEARNRPQALISPEGIKRIELALRLLGQAATNAQAPRPSTREFTVRAATVRRQEPRPPTHGAENTPRHTQPALLSDSGVFPIPSRQRHRALPRVYRLLLAEDDADTVNLYQMVFADGTDDTAHYSVTVARTARECIERLRQTETPFDLLVMDLGIAEPHDAAPERHLLPWLHAHANLRPPRVLVVSGFSGYQLHARMADLRALNAVYLPKPFDVDEMLEAVRALCE